MISYVLGAAGSGKSTLVPLLRPLLPGHVVLDWDAFMDPAGMLAGRPIRESPRTWPAYRDLVRAIVQSLGAVPVVLFGVCTPDELPDWPNGRWILLDCADAERGRRLAGGATRGQGRLPAAIRDAAEYRCLGLPRYDTTGRPPGEAAAGLAGLILNATAGHQRF